MSDEVKGTIEVLGTDDELRLLTHLSNKIPTGFGSEKGTLAIAEAIKVRNQAIAAECAADAPTHPPRWQTYAFIHALWLSGVLLLAHVLSATKGDLVYDLLVRR